MDAITIFLETSISQVLGGANKGCQKHVVP